MKKILTLVLLAAGLFFAAPADAQVKFGVKGGLNVTDMHLNSEVFDKSNQAGWYIGPTVKVSLPVTGLGVDIAALYDYRSAKVTDPSNEEVKVKQQSINVPLNLRYGIGLGSLASIIFHAGPQIGFNVGDKNFKWTDTSNYALKKSNFSVNVGLGVSIAKHFELTGNYNIACGKTADATVLKTVQNVAGTAVKSKSRNNSWQIGVAYYF